MDCKESKEVMGLYVVGALALAETRELEAHMKDCPTCKVERTAAEQVYALLPFALEGPAPPASARRALLERLKLEAAETASERRPSWFEIFRHPAFAYGLLGLALVLMSVAGLRQKTRLADARAEAARLRDQLRLSQTQLAFIQASDTTVLHLAGQPVHPRASGKVFWNKSRNIWLVYASQLPAPPPGKIYELWFLTKNAPIRAGLFTADANGNGFLQVSIPEGVEPIRAGVTLEPEPGVPAPTGALYLLSD